MSALRRVTVFVGVIFIIYLPIARQEDRVTMADNLNVPSGSSGPVATDDIAGVHHQRVKIQYGTDGNATDVSDSNPLPIDDAGGSLTVDNAALSVTGGGVESGTLRVTIANDSTGLVSVDDNAGSLTVDQQFSTAKVSGSTISADPTTSYTSGDVVGTYFSVSASGSATAILKHVSIFIEGAHTGTADMSVIFFLSEPQNVPADDFSYGMGSDAGLVAGTVKMTESANFSGVAGGNGSVGTVYNINMAVANTVYGVIIADNTFDPGVDKLGIVLGFQHD